MKQQLLLLEDVDGLGRSGEIVTAKPGFVRNFLLPKQKALVASKQTVKLQERLKEERAKRAAVDKKESEAVAVKLAELVVKTEVKIDPEGHMYGSVTQLELANLAQDSGFEMIERRSILLPQAIKTLGTHTVPVRLKEGVEAHFTVEIQPEGGVMPEKRVEASKEEAETSEEEPTAEESE